MADDSFSVIFGSDPQYARTVDSGCGLHDDQAAKDCRAQAKIDNQNYVHSMNQLGDEMGADRPKAVIIAGDLTEFGHNTEFKGYKDLWLGGVLKYDNYWPVLGNHDYSNNVDDCAGNDCASRMVKYMRQTVESMKKVDGFDFYTPQSGEYSDWDWYGSLSYSTDIQNVHFVFLQNYPVYINQWQEPGGHHDSRGGSHTINYHITSSLDWLENDLANARAQNKAIVLIYHDPQQHFTDKYNQADGEAIKARYKAMLQKYQVTAVFNGHFHEQIGQFYGNTSIYGDQLMFQTGSGIYSRYLLVTFHPSRESMTVEMVDASNGGVRRSALGDFPMKMPVQPVNMALYRDFNPSASPLCRLTNDVAGSGGRTNWFSGLLPGSLGCQANVIDVAQVDNAPADSLLTFYGWGENKQYGHWATVHFTKEVSNLSLPDLDYARTDANRGMIQKVSGDQLGGLDAFSVLRGASAYQVELTGSNGRHYCSANLWPGDHYSVNFKNGRVPSIDGSESCSNDDVYFFNIKSALAGTHFALYDSPDASTGDDWVEVNVKRDIIAQTGPISVESNVNNDDYQVVFHHKNGLKGKVSAMQVTVGNPS